MTFSLTFFTLMTLLLIFLSFLPVSCLPPGQKNTTRSSNATEKIWCIFLAHRHNHFPNFDINHAYDSLSFPYLVEQRPAFGYATGLLYKPLLSYFPLHFLAFSFFVSFFFFFVISYRLWAIDWRTGNMMIMDRAFSLTRRKGRLGEEWPEFI